MNRKEIKKKLGKIKKDMGLMEIITPLRKETDYYSIYIRISKLLGKI